MSPNPDTAGPPGDPISDFSQCHVGITNKLQALAGLPALLGPAAQARRLAAESLAFFADVIDEHHGAEERELFPAVLASATKGDERSRVQALVERLTAEHRLIEAQWARLVPGLKAVAKGHDCDLEAGAVQRLVDLYLAHAAFEEQEFLPLSHTILSRDSNHLAALAISVHMRHTVPETLARWGHRI
ncbi:MAG: hemerythrin domain-containing protein [Burkholderiaceae bacterium]|nr:hemerythrin domain-containing protein [Burkholderiaceae bacterium]